MRGRRTRSPAVKAPFFGSNYTEWNQLSGHISTEGRRHLLYCTQSKAAPRAGRRISRPSLIPIIRSPTTRPGWSRDDSIEYHPKLSRRMDLQQNKRRRGSHTAIRHRGFASIPERGLQGLVVSMCIPFGRHVVNILRASNRARRTRPKSSSVSISPSLKAIAM